MSPDVPKLSSLMSRRTALLIAAGLVVALVAAIAVPSYFAAKPTFFSRYHSLQRSSSTLESSAHRGLACNQCHVDSRGGAVYRLALVGDFYRGLAGKPDAPRFVRMTKPTREACLACHEHDWSDDSSKTSKLPHPAHLRVASEKRDCVTCHKWIGHEEVYMDKHKAMPFSTVCASFECHVGTKPAADCKNCHHQLQESLGSWKNVHPETVRVAGPNGCLEKCHNADQCRLCHTTGKMPAFPVSLVQSGVKAIEQQHVKADWLSKHGTMALADPSKCLTCHVSEGECQDCHAKRPAFHGTDSTAWIGTHKNFAKDKRRCLTCHQNDWCEECHKQFKEMR